VATIETMRDEGMVENSARLGQEVLGPTLAKLADAHPSVGEVRGLGAFWALELVKDPLTREPLAPYGASSDAMNATVAAARSEGLLPFVNFNRIHVVPPLNISDQDAHRGLEILDRALSVADEHVL
jgi:taurine--2-oxoglutarate transaminase